MKFFSFAKKHPVLFKSSFVVLLIVASFSIGVEKTKSIVPFGGMIGVTYPCLNGVMMTIGSPTPMTLMYMPGAMTYPYGQVYRPGPWVLGTFAPSGVCVEPFPVPPIYTAGTIEMVGTSL